MHKNGRNFKKFSLAAPIGTAATKFLLLIRANNVKFSIYESKIQKFFRNTYFSSVKLILTTEKEGGVKPKKALLKCSAITANYNELRKRGEQ